MMPYPRTAEWLPLSQAQSNSPDSHLDHEIPSTDSPTASWSVPVSSPERVAVNVYIQLRYVDTEFDQDGAIMGGNYSIGRVCAK